MGILFVDFNISSFLFLIAGRIVKQGGLPSLVGGQCQQLCLYNDPKLFKQVQVR
jgi:hypothetical protein